MEWKMPDLGEGIQEGEVIKWLVKEGANISLDQHLVEIMTDKATMEIPSSVEGKLQKILVKEGEVVKVGQTMAVIGEEGGMKHEAPSHEARLHDTKDMKHEVPSHAARSTTPLASPAIRQMAREKGIDLSQISGSGPGGRIVQEDLLKPSTPKSSLQPTPVAAGKEERRPLRGLRRKIAEHMSLSRKTAAHFTHIDEVDLTQLVLLREKAKKEAEKKGIKLTYLPYFIKAVVHGLKKFPQMNASLDSEKQELVLKHYYNIGIAVDTDDGLIVPNIKNADSLSLWDLAKESAKIGEAARSHKITVEQLRGGTFTVTNIGSIGGILSAPIINYPEVAILGLHQIQARPVVKEGRVEVANMMYLTLSADHRVVDGADVARFLNEVIRVLEHPEEI